MEIITAAVIGLGNIGFAYDMEEGRTHPSSHVMGYVMDSDYELKYVIEPDLQKWDDVKTRVGNCDFFRNLDEFLEKKPDENLGVVSICTPPRFHFGIMERILKANICKVVFCEKPIVSDLGEIDEMRRLVGENKSTIVIPNISRRWSTGLKDVVKYVQSGKLGNLKKVNGRYTRGIYNTGSHLFDLLYMISGTRITNVMTLGETPTTSIPEKSFSFYYIDSSGATGYMEPIDDKDYYLFEIDFYFENGKVEFRLNGDELLIYSCGKHHLFEDKTELILREYKNGLLKESHIKNALSEIKQVIASKATPSVNIEDAIYPLYVAKALEQSFESGRFERVNYKA